MFAETVATDEHTYGDKKMTGCYFVNLYGDDNKITQYYLAPKKSLASRIAKTKFPGAIPQERELNSTPVTVYTLRGEIVAIVGYKSLEKASDWPKPWPG